MFVVVIFRVEFEVKIVKNIKITKKTKTIKKIILNDSNFQKCIIFQKVVFLKYMYLKI